MIFFLLQSVGFICQVEHCSRIIMNWYHVDHWFDIVCELDIFEKNDKE